MDSRRWRFIHVCLLPPLERSSFPPLSPILCSAHFQVVTQIGNIHNVAPNFFNRWIAMAGSCVEQSCGDNFLGSIIFMVLGWGEFGLTFSCECFLMLHNMYAIWIHFGLMLFCKFWMSKNKSLCMNWRLKVVPKICGLNGRLLPLKVYAAILCRLPPFQSCEVLTFEVSDCPGFRRKGVRYTPPSQGLRVVLVFMWFCSM
jgi:hypothetical protein